MQVYVFDNTLDGLLTAVFDSFFLHQQPEMLLGEGEQLPLFADEPHVVVTDSGKAARVWKGLEKHLSVEGLRMIAVSWLSEERTLNQPLFNFICKVFRQKGGNNPSSATDYLSLERNASEADVLAVRNSCRRVLHEQLRMKQFIRFQKAKDGTYLAVVSPDHNVLSLIIHHFQDRFNDQPWLIYDRNGTTATIMTALQNQYTSPLRMKVRFPSTLPTGSLMMRCSARMTKYSRIYGALTSRPSASRSV